MNTRVIGLGLVLSALLSLHLVSPAAAQYYDDDPEFRPTGIDVSFGLVSPEEADNGGTWGVALNLGTVWAHWVHLSGGVSRWKTDIDRGDLGDTFDGSIRDFRVYGDLKAMPWLISERVMPYIGAGVGLHFVGANIPSSASLEEALSGTELGVEIKVGARVGTGNFRPFAEIRREAADNVENWAFVIGLGAIFANE